MADDLEELARRLDRIEELLRHGQVASARVTAGPEVRSARSIVSRIDDVWVAVTEGNERVVTTIERLGTGRDGSTPAAGFPQPDRSGAEPGPAGPPPEPAGIARLESAAFELAGRLEAIQGTLAGLARIDEALAARNDDVVDPAVHLRLNRIEEALAGIAGRLGEKPAEDVDGPDLAAGVERLDAEIRRLGQRVDALAAALEASAARSADGTLTDRLGRLRDQFRR